MAVVQCDRQRGDRPALLRPADYILATIYL